MDSLWLECGRSDDNYLLAKNINIINKNTGIL
jgi:hypothetical protein